MSPYEASNGQLPILKIDRDLGYTEKKKEDLCKTHERIRLHLSKYRETYDHPDKRENRYKIGDYVWIATKPMEQGKLSPTWIARGIIANKRKCSYVVKLEDGRITWLNERDLKLVKGAYLKGGGMLEAKKEV